LASAYFGNETDGQNGLYLVYRENFLRFFQPFDHQGPIYTYLIYLPVYLFPWTLLFIPALLALKGRFRTMTIHSKWITWSLLVLFLFLTASGSRRNYYVLPIVPFGILFTVDWILSASSASMRKRLWSAGICVFSFLLIFLAVDLLPALYYAQFGINQFTTLLQKEAEKVKPLSQWKFVMLDAESKLNFYLHLPVNAVSYDIALKEREKQTFSSLVEAWPILLNKPANTIFITRKMHQQHLQSFFQSYRLVTLPTEHNFFVLKDQDVNAPVAFIPAN
jgi:4-amino-4-deoxy-L-arabinose transferase-like glycosyltransferase